MPTSAHLKDSVVSDRFDYPFPLLIVTGKGGVGKTVLTATLGRAAATAGHRTLIVEIGGQQQIPALLSNDVDASDLATGEPTMIADGLGWESISADRLLAGWLSGKNMGLVADRLERSGALSVIATSVPGIKDVLLMGHLRSALESGEWDRVVVDGPASGRARELLRAPKQVALTATEGPIHDQGARAHELLVDHERSAIVLVTTAEETPVNETAETAFDVEDDPGIRLAGVVVNRVFPTEDPSGALGKHPAGPRLARRFENEQQAIARLEEELPVPRLILPEVPGGVIGPDGIDALVGGETQPPTTVDDAVTLDEVDAIDLASPEIIVTVGTGGVGKTSVGAAIAARAAIDGRRVALITVDPARRLADALGLDDLSNELADVELPDAAGTLAATMLDPSATFERVIRRDGTPEQADAILTSKFAVAMMNQLSGMTEYMAVERLWELHHDDDIDLVVVDTPPSADALAFLDAPNLLGRLLDNRVYRLLVHGKQRSFVGRALGGVVGQLVSTVGGSVVRDAVTFFKSFDGLENGFRERGDAMHEILRSSSTSFVVIASATGTSLGQASAFVTDLRDAGVDPTATVVNRCTPAFDPKKGAGGPLVDHLRVSRAAERARISTWTTDTGMGLRTIDELDSPVADLDGVLDLAERLR